MIALILYKVLLIWIGLCVIVLIINTMLLMLEWMLAIVLILDQILLIWIGRWMVVWTG